MHRPDDMPEFSYRGRRQQPQVDPALRRIAIGAAGVSILVIGVALGWSGVRPHMGFGPPPEITAPATPLRVAPADPGGLTVPGANEQIMSGDVSGPPPQLAPAAPAAALAQLQQQIGPPASPTPPPPVARGPAEVQLAATADEAAGERLWSQLLAKMPLVLGSKRPEFVPAVVNGQSVWRLRIGGFADADAAKASCAQVAAQGATCAVASF